jgi:uncharacterized protein YigE (DUF2233 family)
VRLALTGSLLLLAACSSVAEPAATARTGACAVEKFEGAEFTRCTATPGRQTVRTALGTPPYRDLGRLAESLGSKRGKVAFAMNGGMYDEAGQPIGYYVENGSLEHRLNRAEGPGNFHLLPNGVFSVEADGWHVRTTDAFAAEIRRRPAFATQSGPMLVIAGRLHPRIAPDGESLHIRNAVGIDPAGRAQFVISNQVVSFGKLARYMRDAVDTPDALYLDGSVSALWDPAGGRLDRTVPLGPLIVVENTGRAATAEHKDSR